MQFFVERNNQIDGPYSGLQIEALLNSGEISVHTQLRTVGAEGWMTVAEYLKNKDTMAEAENKSASSGGDPNPSNDSSGGLELDFEAVSSPAIDRQKLPGLANSAQADPLVAAALELDKKRRGIDAVISDEPDHTLPLPQHTVNAPITNPALQAVPPPSPDEKPQEIVTSSRTGRRFSVTGLVWPIVLVMAIGLSVYIFSDKVTRVGPAYGPDSHVLFLLHGAGAPADDLLSLGQVFRRQAGQNLTIVLPQGDHRYGSSGYGWTDRRSRSDSKEGLEKLIKEDRLDSVHQIEELIAEAHKEGVPLEHIAVGGFSQGAAIAFDVITSKGIGAKIGAALLFSGGGWEADLDSLEDRSPLRVFVSHGMSDRVLSNAFSRNVVRGLRQGGHTVRYYEFEGGHTIPEQVEERASELLIKWMGQGETPD